MPEPFQRNAAPQRASYGSTSGIRRASELQRFVQPEGRSACHGHFRFGQARCLSTVFPSLSQMQKRRLHPAIVHRLVAGGLPLTIVSAGSWSGARLQHSRECSPRLALPENLAQLRVDPSRSVWATRCSASAICASIGHWINQGLPQSGSALSGDACILGPAPKLLSRLHAAICFYPLGKTLFAWDAAACELMNRPQSICCNSQ